MDSRNAIEPALPAHLAPIRPTSLSRPPAQASGQGEATRNIGPRTLLNGLARYWRLALPLWVVLSAASMWAIYKNVHPIYRSTSLVNINPGQVFDKPTIAGPSHGSYLPTQLSLLTSDAVLRSVSLRDDIRLLPMFQGVDNPVEEIRKNLDTAVRPETTLVEVTMRTRSPEDGRLIVNAVVDAFQEYNEQTGRKENVSTIEELKKAKSDLELAAKRDEAKLIELYDNSDGRIRLGPNGRPVGAEVAKADEQDDEPSLKVTLQEFQSVQREKFVAQLEYEAAVSRLKRAKDEHEALIDELSTTPLEPTRPTVTVESELAKDSEYARLTEAYQRARDNHERAKAGIRSPSDPTRKGAERRLQEAARSLQAYREQKASEFHNAQSPQQRATVDERVHLSEQAIRDAQYRVDDTSTRFETCKKMLDQMDADAQKSVSSTIRIRLAEQSLDILRNMGLEFDTRIQKLQLHENSRRGVQPVDRAVSSQLNDRRMRFMAGAPFGVMAVILAGVLVLEIAMGRVMHPDDLASRLRTEIYTIPPLPTARDDDDRRLEQVEEYSQRMDHLRVALCGPAVAGVGRCVMITSAIGGEGKTTLAAQLAGRCANAGFSTLLIDADLRRPKLARLMEVPEEPGLCDVLSGKVEPEAALVPIGNGGGFHLMPAGGLGVDPGRLLSGQAFGPLLQRLRQAFDVVIIDTPPVLPVPDALQLGRWTDGAIIAVRHDSSRSKLVEKADRLLQSAEIPLLGVVVSGVRGASTSYGSYYGSYRALQSNRSAVTADQA